MHTKRGVEKGASDLGGTSIERCVKGRYGPIIAGSMEVLRELCNLFDGQFDFVSRRKYKKHEKNLRRHIAKLELAEQTGIKTTIVVRNRKQKARIYFDGKYTLIIDNCPETIFNLLVLVDASQTCQPRIFMFRPDEEKLEEFREIISRVTIISDWEEILENPEIAEMIETKTMQHAYSVSAR